MPHAGDLVGEMLVRYGVQFVRLRTARRGKLGWLQMWQHLHYEGLRQSVDLEREGRPPDSAGAGAALDGAFAASGPVVVDIRIDPDATPIPSSVERLESGEYFPRPGTVYGLREWTRSPEDVAIESRASR